MSTTVEVKRHTAKVLEELKKKYHAKSMGETLRHLINKAENIPETMLGAHPEITPFSPKDESEFHEL